MTDTQSIFLTKKPLLHLVYGSTSLPIITQQIPEPSITSALGGNQSSISWVQQTPSQCLGIVNFNGHRCHVAGLAMPLPHTLIDHTVMVSPWLGQVKAAMRHHRSHLSLAYEEGSHDPVEQMIALYTLAHAFETEDLLGVINPNAWTAHPAADFLSPKKIASYRQNMPFSLWVGYIRFYVDENSFWLVTKGHHIFDVPDLAAFVKPGDDPQAMIDLFINVFHYLYKEDVFVTAGDTLEVGSSGEVLHFAEVTELEEALMGPSGTLVITHKSQRN